MLRAAVFLTGPLLLSICVAAEEKKEPGQRKRPQMPEITKPVLFNTAEADKILEALEVFPPEYGMFVADNGGDWRLSVAPDARIKGLEDLKKLKGSDFEVVEPTGPNEGPRKK
jgi:hypothetical protein